MSTWLRNKRHDEDIPPVSPEIGKHLPPSVRRPDDTRLTPSGSAGGPDDGVDADLDFFTKLAGDVDHDATNSPAGRSVSPLRGASPRIDDMQVFRELKDDSVKVSRFDHQIDDVEMGDLLEELSTVRAALRGRRAA